MQGQPGAARTGAARGRAFPPVLLFPCTPSALAIPLAFPLPCPSALPLSPAQGSLRPPCPPGCLRDRQEHATISAFAHHVPKGMGTASAPRGARRGKEGHGAPQPTRPFKAIGEPVPQPLPHRQRVHSRAQQLLSAPSASSSVYPGPGSCSRGGGTRSSGTAAFLIF